MRTLMARIERLEERVPKPAAGELSRAEILERVQRLDEAIARRSQPDPAREAERARRAKLPLDELLALLLTEEPTRIPEERFTSPELTVGQRLSARVEALGHIEWERQVKELRDKIAARAAAAG